MTVYLDDLMQRAREYGAQRNAERFQAAMEFVVAEFHVQHPFGSVEVTLEPAGKTYRCALADTDETRARGMIGQTFENFEAMLFAYDSDVQHQFHMDGVTEQLYIAWFDAEGRVVDHMGMFRKDPFRYAPQRPFRYVLEMPAVSGGNAGSPWVWLDGQTLTIKE